MIALIDGDIVAYRVGFSSEKEGVQIALHRVDTTVQTILAANEAKEYELYMSDSLNNFRLKLWPKYKANRKGKSKPRWLEHIKEHLFASWNAKLARGQEADDALGIRQVQLHNATLDPDSSVICSNDKDLLQIEGLHYNIATGLKVRQSSWWGLNWFYQQLLIGDVADNITGVRGVGKVWAERLLAPAKSEEELFKIVRDLYRDDERLLLNGRLLKIRTRQEEIWEFPKQSIINQPPPSQGETLSSITGTQVGTIPSTEPITQEMTSGSG